MTSGANRSDQSLPQAERENKRVALRRIPAGRRHSDDLWQAGARRIREAVVVRQRGVPTGRDPILTLALSALKSAMHTMREFSRRLSHFKRLAAAGKRIQVVDRQGKLFVFQAERPKTHLGAGKHLGKGKALLPDRTPKTEWKGNE